MNGKINIVVQTPLLNPANFQAIAAIEQQHANMVALDWNLPPQTVSIGTQVDPTAWLNVIVGDTHLFPVNVLGEHEPADKNGNVIAYVSAHKTLTRAGAPFGSIVHGRKATAFSKGTPDKLVSDGFMECLTHEIAESMVDPGVNKWALAKSKNQNWLVEVGDQAHAYLFIISYTDPKTKMVTQAVCADYTLPSFYQEGAKAPYSHTGKVSAPFTLDVGCYAKIIDATTGKPVAGSATDLD